MLRRLAVIALTLVASVSLASAQIGGGVFGRPAHAQVKEVCKSGCAYSVICGADCTSTTYTCTAGSAVGSITDSSATKPYRIEVGPGVYNECVTTGGKDNISFVGAGGDSTILRPTVTAPSSIDHGTFYVTFDSDNVEIAGLWIQQDSWPSYTKGGSAITVADNGAEGTTCTFDSCWRGLHIHDNTIIAQEAGIRLFGYSAAAVTDYPTGSIHNNIIRAGAYGIMNWDGAALDIFDNDILTRSNYCTTSTHGAPTTNTIYCGTSCTASTFGINNLAQGLNFFRGHRVVITNGGVGTCPANVEKESRTLESYNNANNQVIVDRAFSSVLTEDCTATIYGAPFTSTTSTTGYWGPPECSDIDWRVMAPTTQASNGGYGIWLKEGSACSMDTEMRQRDRIYGNKINVQLNDLGPEGGYTCGSRVGVMGISASCGGFRQEFTGNDITLDINTTLEDFLLTHSDAVGCTSGVDCCNIDQVAGIGLAGSSNVSFSSVSSGQVEPVKVSNNTIRVRNNGDPNLNIHGILAEGATQIEGHPPSIDAESNTIHLQQPLLFARRVTGAGASTSITTEMRSTTDAAVNAFPAAAVGATLLMGVINQQTASFTVDIATAAIAYTITWEYWKGAGVDAWTAFPAGADFVDGTSSLTVDGVVSFVPIASAFWGFSNDNNVRERLLWIRARVTGGALTQMPTLNSILISNGNSYHFGQYNNAVLKVGSTETTDGTTINTVGTLTGWSEKCVTLPDIIVTDDNVPFPLIDSNVGVKIAYVSCSCHGTCAGAEDILFETSAAAQIGAGNITCTDNTAARSWTDVRTDADGSIAPGLYSQFDTVTAGGATDDFVICVRATTSRWTP